MPVDKVLDEERKVGGGGGVGVTSHTKILGPSKSPLKLVKKNYKQSPTASKATAETR